MNTIQTIIDDMTLPHEDKLHGIPSTSNWAHNPRIGFGTSEKKNTFTAFTAWGQIYETADGNSAKNTRVQIRRMRAYYMSKKQKEWIVLQAIDPIEGAAYVEDFVDDVSIQADIRDESNNGGGISVTAGNGYNFHFWPQNARKSIDPEDVDAVFTTYEARLIVNDENLPDDRSCAKYLAGGGGDYWKNLTATWTPGWTSNNDFAIGRMKFVTCEWQSFNAYAGSFDLLAVNPPPINEA